MDNKDINEKDFNSSDYLINKKYIYSDSSEINFGDNEFYWYRKAGAYDDNYYYGSYTCFRGEEACKYAIASEIISEENLEQYFNRTSGNDFYCRENTFILILHNEYVCVEGNKKDFEEGKSETKYYGFFNGEMGDTVNLITGAFQKFVLKES